MNIPKSINEMESTPIPKEYLDLLKKGDYEYPNLLQWLKYRCGKDPTNDEAIARIRIHREGTTELLPEKVDALLVKGLLTSTELLTPW